MCSILLCKYLSQSSALMRTSALWQMSLSITKSECEEGPQFVDSVHNYVTVSDFAQTSSSRSCHCAFVTLFPWQEQPQCLGVGTQLSGLQGYLQPLHGWAYGIPFRKVIGPSHTGVQALTCHTLAGAPLLKGLWQAIQSMS